jgi:hypothetical protein
VTGANLEPHDLTPNEVEEINKKYRFGKKFVIWAVRGQQTKCYHIHLFKQNFGFTFSRLGMMWDRSMHGTAFIQHG